MEDKYAEAEKQIADMKATQVILTQKSENLLTELVSVQQARGETEATLKTLKGTVAIVEKLRTEMADVQHKLASKITKECGWAGTFMGNLVKRSQA